MNIQPNIKNNHNADVKFKEFNTEIEQIQGGIVVAATHMRSSDACINNALGSILDLGLKFINKRDDENDKKWVFLKGFLDFHNIKWTTKCDANFFHGIVDTAFNFIDPNTKKVFTSAPMLSKYRLVLKFAFEGEMNGQELVADLSKRTFTKIYDEAVKKYSKNPLDIYIEDNDQRYQRAVNALSSVDGLVLPSFTDKFESPDIQSGFISAMVHVENGQFKIVGFHEAEKKDKIKARVASLVPDEALHGRKMLTDKNLYWLYVICDVFNRFLPPITEQVSWNRPDKKPITSELNADSTDEEIHEHLTGIINQGKAKRALRADEVNKVEKTSGSNKFVRLHALKIDRVGLNWIVSTLTTHPNTPCLEISINDPKPRHLLKLPLTLTDKQTNQFANNFLKPGEWRCGGKADRLVITQGSTSKVILEDHTKSTKWRSLDPQLSTVATFEVSKKHLLGLRRWKDDCAQAYGRSKFTTKQKLVVADDKIYLAFANNPSVFKVLGELTDGTAKPIGIDRYFDFKSIEKMLQLADDYGVSIEVQLLSGHQGCSALKFGITGLPFQASITLPLLLSLQGNPIEIAV